MRIFISIAFLFATVFPQSSFFKRSDFGEICLSVGLPKTCLDDVRIVFADDKDELHRLSGGAIPEWGAGFAVPGDNAVVILKSGDVERLRAVLVHELTHIALHKKLSPRSGAQIGIPRWFDEGVAQRLSGGLLVSRQSRIAWAVLWRNVIPLQALERVNEFNSPGAKLAYAEAHDAVLFLERLCPIRRICDSVSAAEGFQEGFRRATGMTIYEFYERWHKHLLSAYLPFVILGDQRFLWTFVVLVFVLFGMFRFIRQRRELAKLHRLADEERWEKPDDLYDNDFHF